MSQRSVVASLFAASLLAASAFAGQRYVNVNLAGGANDGSSWANAYRTADGVSLALAAAVSGDEVWVAAGTYLPTTLGTRTLAVQLKNGVAVYGGFAGNETLLSQRDVALNVTVLSGDLGGNDGSSIFTDNSYHVVNAASTNASAILDGFVVRGGNANGAASNQDRGGGILCVGGASPTVRRCTFTSNRCSFGGGAGYINGSSPSFSDCVFESNLGGSFGGAFDMASGVGATFDRCVFRNNSAARAGAIEIFGSSPVRVLNSLFYGNVCNGSGGGGAIFVSSSAALIRNCTVVQNSCTVNAAGGGLLVSGGSPTVTNCIFDQNTAAGGASGASAQISPTTGVAVTYSMIPAGYAGTGNIGSTPLYDNSGALPFRLTVSSPGLDAGNNAGVPAGVLLDLAGAPRFQEVLSVPNSGSGSAPIVDIGAFEFSPDCNGNNVPDFTDIANGASPDVNGNNVPDECECSGGTPPVVYCSSKLNSQFCLPAVSFQGNPSASNATSFTIHATNIINNKSGLLFYGYTTQSTPFLGGTLCVAAPIRRTAVMSSGGSAAGTDCSGTFSFDFNGYIASGADPLLIVGQSIGAQFWSRDPQDPFTTSLTNAVRFGICQ
ncbi:MAG: right-handed parallel beta-helix repeat-containing protein [Planctomycetes bacterium]|nr:right-handed parallel beta-helix repeat-containing protein [Planctomycetota bacterium]